ncbi:SIR2 family protein [Bacillus pumilus]|uniref:SIR2 family protein n=1 Tax=Bacillus pumilus TaxID=1408 RepID=UPI0021B235DB|nr:SIR2 family protein [Bacillus pumilus]
MSLTQLIHTVSIKVQLNEEDLLEKLKILAEVVKDEIFPKERLTHYNIDLSTIETILNELLRMGFASKYFTYDCEDTDSVDFAVNLNEKCAHCGQTLKNSENHLINESYKLNSIYLELIKDQKKENLKKYLIDDFRPNLEKLKSRTKKLIPFLGAGVSIPFRLPSWGDLLRELERGLSDTNREKYIDIINKGDYLRALSFLKLYSGLYKNESMIKKEIKNIIKRKYVKESNLSHHNIIDILKLDTQFILTTNYDNIVSDFLRDYRDEFIMPQILETLDDLQDLMDDNSQKVIHLHGNVEIPNSMIVTKDDYDKLYEANQIKYVLNGIMSNRTLLFIGFSFEDEYFKDLYDKIFTYIKGEHFIIVPNLHPFDAEELLRRHLIPIGINVNKNEKHDFVKGIKTVLEELY